MAKSGSSKSGSKKAPDAARKVLFKRAKGKAADVLTPVSEDIVRSAPVAAHSDPSDEDVRVRAYFRYLERGGSNGASHEDWAEAKKDLTSVKRHGK